MQVRGCPERPDGHAGEGAEGGAGGARSAQDRQQGVAAPEAARRDRARASFSAREPQRDRECTYLEWTLLLFCEMGQTFTVLIRV